MSRTYRPLMFAASVATILASLLYWAVQASSADSGAPTWTAPERPSRKQNPVPADAQSIAVGKEVYVRECLSCHGAGGKGDGPAARGLAENPGDLTSPQMGTQSDGALFWKITTGKKPMPTEETRLTEDQRWAVVNYLRTLPPSASRPAGTTSNQAPANAGAAQH